MLSKSRYSRKANHSENDDLIDRINSRYTVSALMLAVLIVSVKLYIGNPINCWTPGEFHFLEQIHLTRIDELFVFSTIQWNS